MLWKILAGIVVLLVLGTIAFFAAFLIAATIVISREDISEDDVENIQRACDPFPVSDYDTFTVIETEDGTLEVTSRYSEHNDSDQHSWRLSDADGTLIGHREDIRVNSVLYSRITSDDDPHTFEPWVDNGAGYHAAHFLCFPGPEAQANYISETGQEGHIISTERVRDDDGTETKEFWLNAEGLPVRARRSYIPDDGTSAYFNITYSGFGEPNIITAPSLP